MNMFTDMFKGNGNQQPTQQQQQQPPQNKDLSQPNPGTDQNGQMPGTQQMPVNPLDAYAKMFENASKNSDIQAPSFKVDPKVVGEVANSMDFVSKVDPALMEKALTGDVKSLMEVIQATGRASYSASLEHLTSLTDAHLAQRAEFESKRINSGVREQLTSSELASAPNYDHPVVKQELNRIAAQFAKANPDASPQEIARSAQEYMVNLGKALSPNAPDAGQEKEMDWTKYLSSHS